MTFHAWAEGPWSDGTHTIVDWPLDALHPLRHGPISCTVEAEGGTVRSCRFDVHAAHRGDEKLLEVRNVRQGLALINRHGWLTAPFAETLYARLVESLLGITVSPRADALRTLSLEINRVAVEALWEHLEGSLTGTPNDGLVRREQAVSWLERLTGARLHSNYVRIGGVAYDIDPELLQELGQVESLASAADAVARSEGVIDTSLPKSLRLPVGDVYGEIDTPHGSLGIWVVGRGDRTPQRVHLRPAGFVALSRLEREAIGVPMPQFLDRLARTRLVHGEVAR